MAAVVRTHQLNLYPSNTAVYDYGQ